MDKLFQLEIGSWSNLKGHAVVYWETQQKEGSLILAVNFCISAFPFDGSLIATTFPLSSFYSKEEFMFYVQKSSVDLISIEDVSPKDISEDYILTDQQYTNLNKVIKAYLDVFKTKISDSTDNLSAREKIELTKTWLNHLQKQDNKNSKTHNISIKTQIRHLIYDLHDSGIPIKEVQEFLTILDSRKWNKYEILSLYLQVFLAILTEEYEHVIKMRQDIQQLQTAKRLQKKKINTLLKEDLD